VRVELIAKVGADVFGTAVLDSLAVHGEHLAAGILVCAAEPTSYTIVISPPGVDRSFLHCPGANQSFSAQDVPYGRLAGVRLFHFGYPPLMPRMYADGGAELRAMFARVVEAGVATSLDLCEPDPESDAGRVDWQEVLGQALPFVDVFAPSIDELLFVFDRPAHERLQAGAPLASVVDHSRLAKLGGLLTTMGAVVVAIKLEIRVCISGPRRTSLG
jgi:sugar/nucleoside kinase (ribokinase family)